MDAKLVAWGRAVKSRSAWAGPRLPPLWLFTDPARMDVLAAVERLPAGLCGVVFRHDGAPGRAALARAVQRACRQRRLAFVLAGRTEGLHAPRHLRDGRGHTGLTASAHGPAALVRARRRRVAAAFLSPAFPTRSHPGAVALGPVRWAGLARRIGWTGLAVFALGGIDGRTVRRLPRGVAGIGAIGGLIG